MTKKLILKELDRYSIGTYADVIYRNALFRANQEAFIYGDKRITFAGFNERVNSLIHALQSMGLKKGDGIGILSWNCLECTDITGAAMKGGFIVSPFNPRMQKDELEYLINYSEVKVLFVGPELMQMANELRPVLKDVTHYVALEQKADNMAFHDDLLASHSKEEPDVDVKETDLSSYSTRAALPVCLVAQCTPISGKWKKQKTKIVQVGLKPANKHIMILPLFHIGGWSHFWAFFYVGACNVIMPQRSFDPQATLQAIQDENATDIHIVPTILSVSSVPGVEKYKLTNLERMWYAASPMPLELLRKDRSLRGSLCPGLWTIRIRS